jgi:hypothetical protein
VYIIGRKEWVGAKRVTQSAIIFLRVRLCYSKSYKIIMCSALNAFVYSRTFMLRSHMFGCQPAINEHLKTKYCGSFLSMNQSMHILIDKKKPRRSYQAIFLVPLWLTVHDSEIVRHSIRTWCIAGIY